MSWITFVVIAILADVFRVYLDNYITDVYFKGRCSIAQRLFYGVAYIFIALSLTIFCAPHIFETSLTTLGLFFLSGVISSLSGIPYYRALEIDDSTNLGIFFQFAPVLYLILNWLFFGESISPLQFISIFVILAAPAAIVITAGKRSRRTRFKSMLLVLLSVVIEVIGSLIFIHLNDPNTGFINEIIPVFLGHGIANIIMIVVRPKWRKRFFAVVHDSRHKVYFPMLFDSVVSAAKIIAYRATLILAPTVALASAASDAVSPIAIFFFGLVLTLIWPNFGREKLKRKTILTHLISTILVAVGIILMQL